MAITIVSNPGVTHALYGNGTLFKVSTDRTIGTGSAIDLTARADNGLGDIEFTTDGAHGIIAGDTVLISGTAEYNGVELVTEVADSTHFAIDKATSGTGAYSGNEQAFGYNQNFKIKCEIQNPAGTTIYATKYIYPISAFFYLDLDNILGSLVGAGHLDYDADAVDGSKESNVVYNVKFTEVFDDDSGTAKDGSYLVSSGITRCFNMSADYNSEIYYCEDESGKFLTVCPTIKIYDDDDWQIHANINDGCRVLVRYSVGGAPADNTKNQFYPPTTSALITPDEARVVFPMNEQHLDKFNGWFTDSNTTGYDFTLVGNLQTSGAIGSNGAGTPKTRYATGYTPVTLSSVADVGGAAEFRTSGAHGYEIGDIVEIYGTSNYNDIVTIVTKTATAFYADVTYAGADSGNVITWHGMTAGDYIYVDGGTQDAQNYFQTVGAVNPLYFDTDKDFVGIDAGGANYYPVYSETKTVVKITQGCKDVSVQFLNWLGGFDNFSFINETQKTKVTREAYKSDDVDMQRNVRAKRTRKLVSGWLSSDWVDFVEQLLTSPEVYVLEDSEWKRCTIVSSEMKYRSNDLINLEIELKGQELNIVK